MTFLTLIDHLFDFAQSLLIRVGTIFAIIIILLVIRFNMLDFCSHNVFSPLEEFLTVEKHLIFIDETTFRAETLTFVNRHDFRVDVSQDGYQKVQSHNVQ